MTIRLGSATVTGSTVSLIAPGGFGTFQAVRLTNFTSLILILTGIDSDDPGGQEYLLPLQQNVYRTNNISKIPTITGIVAGGAGAISSVLVEWSDNPLKDLPGTYPTAIGMPLATPGFNAGALALSNAYSFTTPDPADIYIIPGNPLRARLVVTNTSAFTGLTPGGQYSTTVDGLINPQTHNTYLYSQSEAPNTAWDTIYFGNRDTSGVWHLNNQLRAGQTATLQSIAQVGFVSTQGSTCGRGIRIAWTEETYA